MCRRKNRVAQHLWKLKQLYLNIYMMHYDIRHDPGARIMVGMFLQATDPFGLSGSLRWIVVTVLSSGEHHGSV